MLLASLAPAELAAHFDRVKPVAYTQYTLTSRDKLAKAIDAVREQGYSIVDQELEIGLRSIAVPVFDTSGKAVAAINIGAQASRASARHMQQEFLPPLHAAARELSLLLA